MKKLLPLIILMLARCATVPMASEAEDAEAKRFQTLPGQANLYVFRDIGVGTALTFQAAVDGRLIGLIA